MDDPRIIEGVAGGGEAILNGTAPGETASTYSPEVSGLGVVDFLGLAILICLAIIIVHRVWRGRS